MAINVTSTRVVAEADSDEERTNAAFAESNDEAMSLLITAFVFLNPAPSGSQIRALAQALGVDSTDIESYDALVSNVTAAILAAGAETSEEDDDDDEGYDGDFSEEDDSDDRTQESGEGSEEDPPAEGNDEKDSAESSDDDVPDSDAPGVSDEIPTPESAGLADALTIALNNDGPIDAGQEPDSKALEFDGESTNP